MIFNQNHDTQHEYGWSCSSLSGFGLKILIQDEFNEYHFFLEAQKKTFFFFFFLAKFRFSLMISANIYYMTYMLKHGTDSLTPQVATVTNESINILIFSFKMRLSTEDISISIWDYFDGKKSMWASFGAEGLLSKHLSVLWIAELKVRFFVLCTDQTSANNCSWSRVSHSDMTKVFNGDWTVWKCWWSKYEVEYKYNQSCLTSLDCFPL